MDPFGRRRSSIFAFHDRDAVPVTTYLDLRPEVHVDVAGTARSENGNAVDELLAVVLFSRQPLPLSADVFDFVDEQFRAYAYPVEPAVVNAEGDISELDEGGSDIGSATAVVAGPLVFGPPTPPTTIPSTAPLDLSFPLVVTQWGDPNTNAAKNQCVPIAHADAIAYLENRYNQVPLRWSVEEIGTRGLGQQTLAGDVVIWDPVPDHSIVANVDTFTRRMDAFSLSQGKGSSRCQNIRGLMGYLASFGSEAQVVMRHQGGSAVYGDGASCTTGLIDLGGLTSTLEDEEVTWQWIYDQLSLGRSVVMSFSRYDLFGAWASGHMLRVRGASMYNNKQYLMTMDDAWQGNNTAGTQWQTWEVRDKGQPTNGILPNGRLELGGTNWEIKFALSMEAKPTLLIP